VKTNLKVVSALVLLLVGCDKLEVGSGRYQIISGEFETLSIVKDREERLVVKTLFKIDTHSGRVWQYEPSWEGDVEARKNFGMPGLWEDRWKELPATPAIVNE